MSGITSGKVICVLAATAFVGAFRVQAGEGDTTPDAAGATLSGARVSALKTDTVRIAAAPAAAALGEVAALPALHRAHPVGHKKHRTHKKAKVTKHKAKKHVTVKSTPKVVAPVAPAPTATVAPVVPQKVYTPPATSKPKTKTYVGKSFDSKG